MSFQRNGKTPQIGEVYLMKFSGSGSEQVGWRPGLVFQNNVGNSHSPNVIALPLTSSIKKASQPTRVFIKASDAGLKKDSMVLCENPQRMSKDNLGKYLGKLSDACVRVRLRRQTFLPPVLFPIWMWFLWSRHGRRPLS